MTEMSHDLRCLLNAFWLHLRLMGKCQDRMRELDLAGIPVKGDPELGRLLRVAKKARSRFRRLYQEYRCT